MKSPLSIPLTCPLGTLLASQSASPDYFIREFRSHYSNTDFKVWRKFQFYNKNNYT